jgi:hypothetical protein
MNKIINFYYSYPLPKGGVEKSDLTPQPPRGGFVIICLSTTPPWGGGFRGVLKGKDFFNTLN